MVLVAASGVGQADAATGLQERRFGVNIHWMRAGPESVAELKDAFSVVRQDFSWAGVEKVEGVYNFSAYDSLLAELGPGVAPYLILDYGNPLYHTSPSNTPPYPSVIAASNTAAIQGFVRYAIAAMRRYRGRGVVWELWNEPNGKWCCGHILPTVYASLAIAIKNEAKKAPELDEITLIGPTTCGLDLAFMKAVWEAGGLAAIDAISWHPYRSGGPETVSKDYAAVRDLARKHGGRVPPVVSGEWGYATCTTQAGDPAPCVGGATGGSTVSVSQQGSFLARQWLVNAMEGIPISIWYDWADANECTVGGNSSSAECYGVFRSRRGGMDPADPAAHGAPKPAYRAAVNMHRMIGPRPFVKRLSTFPPPQVAVVQPTMQDAADVYILAFGPPVPVGSFPPAAAVPTSRVEVLAVWSVSDVETSTTLFDRSLSLACFNRTSLYGVGASQSYCFNETGHLQLGLITAPDFYTRTPLKRGQF